MHSHKCDHVKFLLTHSQKMVANACLEPWHTILEPSKMEINFAVQILCISMLDPFSVQISMVKPFDLQKQFFLTPFENVAIYQTSQSSILILQSKKRILIHILITYSLQEKSIVSSQNIKKFLNQEGFSRQVKSIVLFSERKKKRVKIK